MWFPKRIGALRLCASALKQNLPKVIVSTCSNFQNLRLVLDMTEKITNHFVINLISAFKGFDFAKQSAKAIVCKLCPGIG